MSGVGVTSSSMSGLGDNMSSLSVGMGLASSGLKRAPGVSQEHGHSVANVVVRRTSDRMKRRKVLSSNEVRKYRGRVKNDGE